MEREDKNRPVQVFVGDSFHANMVKNILENEEITAFINNEIVGTVLPIFSSPLDTVKVMVPMEKFDIAMAIVNDYKEKTNR